MVFQEDKLLEILSDLSPKKDSRGENFIIDCPICGYRECSISIHRDGHQWGCFRLKKCGERGNIFSLLKHLGLLNQYSQGRKKLSDIINIEELFPDLAAKSKEELDSNLEELPEIKPPFGWKRITETHPYLEKRGFKSYKESQVGETVLDPSLKNYIVFLVREDSRIKGYVGRHTWDKKDIEEYNQAYFLKHGRKNKIKRYNNAPGVDFGKLLYGIDEIQEPRPVVLVEGIFDKHALDVKLEIQESRELYTCATFKAAVSSYQIIKLLNKGIQDVILFYDPDVIKIIQRNAEVLSNFFNVKVVLTTSGKDPDEMTQEEVFEAFEKHLYSPEEIVSDFIQPPVFK